jgi:hypothetical protein
MDGFIIRDETNKQANTPTWQILQFHHRHQINARAKTSIQLHRVGSKNPTQADPSSQPEHCTS